MSASKLILATFGAAVAGSLFVLLAGLCLFGFHLSEWPEWQGRMIGLIGTFAGATGAAIALQILCRDHSVADSGKRRRVESRRRGV
jgi:hypothetical protein